jgi:glycosyltransferase involved in cell wall biosynthesis
VTAKTKPTASPVICILTLSRIPDDSRVRRQGDAFSGAGWHVIGIGLSGARSPAPHWQTLDADCSVPNPEGIPIDCDGQGTAHPVFRHVNRIFGFLVNIGGRIGLAIRYPFVRIVPAYAGRLYWSATSKSTLLYAAGRTLQADIWVANDWVTLPIAARLAGENGGAFAYDAHEFASEEFAEQWKWRFFKRPLVCAVEQKLIGRAAVVSTVSSRIAELLTSKYQLSRLPIVIRNVPAYQKICLSPTGNTVSVLYHGIIAPERGLEQTIDSVAAWRPEFRLILRGPGAADYIKGLHARVVAAGVERRVTIAPAVPMSELVREAAKSDIGLHPLPGHSLNNQCALPNKLFEYIMAGLCLCVTDLPEMSRIVRDGNLGRTFAKVDPISIAAAINNLDRTQIDLCKANSVRAATQLCWEQESERLVRAYSALVPAPGPASVPA